MVYTRTRYIHQFFWGEHSKYLFGYLNKFYLSMLVSKITETKNLKKINVWLCKDVNIFGWPGVRGKSSLSRANTDNQDQLCKGCPKPCHSDFGQRFRDIWTLWFWLILNKGLKIRAGSRHKSNCKQATLLLNCDHFSSSFFSTVHAVPCGISLKQPDGWYIGSSGLFGSLFFQQQLRLQLHFHTLL